MEAIYKLNTRELNPGFISSLQDAYPDRDVEITVREAEMDETEYLLQSPVNRERLLKAVRNIEQGQNIVTFETLEDAVQAARK